MAKRIALFMDGTWGSADDQTNVRLMHDAVAERGHDGMVQQKAYFPGVGTRIGEVALGGMLGWGLDRNVREAYEYLVRHYAAGDEIYLFGFSRGAYTARSLAGMIAKCGLLEEGGAADVLWLWNYYSDSQRRRLQEILFDRDTHGKVPAGDEAWLVRRCARREIKCIGVWDTVGSLGVPFGNIPGLSRRSYRFHNTRPSRSYESCFQALAIDELRTDFTPTLLTRFLLKQVPLVLPANEQPFIEQRWFIGSHSNVGGGIRGNRLSQIPLHWMMGRAEEKGLAIARPIAISPDAVRDRVEDSLGDFMGGAYRLLRPKARKDRTIGSPPRDLVSRDGAAGLGIVVNEMIDASVFERWRTVPGYRPPALADWARRRGLDPGELQGDQTA